MKELTLALLIGLNLVNAFADVNRQTQNEKYGEKKKRLKSKPNTMHQIWKNVLYVYLFSGFENFKLLFLFLHSLSLLACLFSIDFVFLAFLLLLSFSEKKNERITKFVYRSFFGFFSIAYLNYYLYFFSMVWSILILIKKLWNV